MCVDVYAQQACEDERTTSGTSAVFDRFLTSLELIKEARLARHSRDPLVTGSPELAPPSRAFCMCAGDLNLDPLAYAASTFLTEPSHLPLVFAL